MTDSSLFFRFRNLHIYTSINTIDFKLQATINYYLTINYFWNIEKLRSFGSYVLPFEFPVFSSATESVFHKEAQKHLPRRKKMFVPDILRFSWYRLPFFARFEFAWKAIAIKSHALLLPSFVSFLLFTWYNRIFHMDIPQKVRSW